MGQCRRWADRAASRRFLFADVRGSTTIAEHIAPAEFGALMNRFYDVVSQALVEHGAFIDKLVGDEVVSYFPPCFAGANTAEAAVGADGAFSDLTALGDSVNVAARLASRARAGEALVSRACWDGSGRTGTKPKSRRLRLKGRAEPIEVVVLTAS